MSTTTGELIARAKIHAQDPAHTPLLFAEDAYERMLTAALKIFDADRPNCRIVHHTIASGSAFRFVLSGTGVLAGLTGLDAWVLGASRVLSVWHPYSTATAGANRPLDANDWRVVREPSLVVLELVESVGTGVLRLEFVRPHVVDDDDTAATSVEAGDVEPLSVLVASKILDAYAVAAVQNTGSTGFPADVVDRRSQSDQARSRAKTLYDTYRAMIGSGSTDGSGPMIAPAAAVGDFDVQPQHSFGWLWHGTRIR